MEHTCVYYDDGWPDLTCVCGERVAQLIDDYEALLVCLETARPATPERLPISA